MFDTPPARLLLPAPVPQPERAVVPSSPITLLLKTWLSGFSPATRRSYLGGLEDFAGFVKAASVEDSLAKLFTCSKREAAAVVAAWREDMLHTRGRSPATVNVRQAALRSLLAAAREFDFVQWEVRLKDLRVSPYRDVRGPGLENLQKMLERCERTRDGELRCRNVAIVRLLFDCALRCSELTGLDLADVDLPGKRIWILGKGKTQREPFPLPPPTVQALAVWIRKRGTLPGPLFPSLSNNKRGKRINRQVVFRLIRDLGRAVGVRTRPHAVRHASITVAATSLSLLDARRFARHADVKTTLKYVDQAADIPNKVAKAVADKLKSAEPEKPVKPR